METKTFKLRHSASLVPAYLILFILVAYLGFHGLGIWIIVVAFVVLSCFTFLGYWHNVTYREGMVTGILFPWKPVSINIADISEVRQETDMLRYETRRCLAIYDKRNKRVIKISLAVFIQSDLRKLIEIIHELRPDLSLPEINKYWMGSKW